MHQLLELRLKSFIHLVRLFTNSLCAHVCFPSQACHIEGGSAGLIPSQLLEEKRKAFVKRDLELATTGTHLSSTKQSRDTLLIMQIRHRLLAAQTHGQDNIWSSPYHTSISSGAGAAHPPLTCLLLLSVRTGELVMSIA